MSSFESGLVKISRRTMLTGLAGAGFALATPAIAAGKGSFRSLSVVNNRTAEKLTTAYWLDGEYIPEAMEAFNYIMRDWREDEIIQIEGIVSM